MPTITRSDVTVFSQILLGALSVAVAFTALLRIGEVEINGTFAVEGTRSAFLWMRQSLDLAWGAAAFFAAYWCCVVEDGLKMARLNALIALILALALGVFASRVSFGTGLVVRFTDQAGPPLPGRLSSGFVLLSGAILIAIRSALLKFRRHWPLWRLSMAGAALAGGVYLLIQAFVAVPRAWWLWVAADATVRAAKAPWISAIPWLVGGGLYLILTQRKFSARESNGGWILLANLAAVALACAAARIRF